MFDFPQVPETRSTQQIECVSCQHVFVAPIEDPNAPTPRLWNWARIFDLNPSSRHRMPHQMHPQAASADTGTDYHSIICPRCGTDNRNWIKYRDNMPTWWKNSPAGAGLVIAIALLILSLWQVYTTEVSAKYWVLLIIVFFLFSWVIPQNLIHQWLKLRQHKHEERFLQHPLPPWQRWPEVFQNTLLLFIFGLFGSLIFATILIPWGSYTFERLVNPPAETLPERVDAILVALPEKLATEPSSTELLPAAASIVALTNVVNQVEQSCNLTPVSNIIKNLQSLLAANPMDQRAILLQSTVNNLQDLQGNYNSTCQEGLQARAITSINELRRSQDEVCIQNDDSAACALRDYLDGQIAELDTLNPYISQQEPMPPVETKADWMIVLQRLRPITTNIPNEDIKQRIETNLIPLEELAGTAVSNTSWFTAGAGYLEIWVVNAGLAGLISLITALVATHTYAEEADRHLPRPIYENVTRLSLVVVREAAGALEISNDYMDDIQWMGTARNQFGGINIIGLFRDPPEQLADGRYGEQVRAQQFLFKSNQWGHIVEAMVIDRDAPRPAGFAPCRTIQIPSTQPRPALAERRNLHLGSG